MTKILVVDDSALDRRMVREILQGEAAWVILEAVDGKDALRQCEADLPDLVLTDLQMPEVDGLELVSVLKEKHPQLPVILMTAQGSEEIAVKALRHGADSYIPKSTLADELMEIVPRMLEVYREELVHRRLLTHMNHHECRFDLANDLELIHSLIRYLRQGVLQMTICDDSDQFRVAIALEESLLNAYYHGNLELDSSLREEDHGKFAKLAEERRHIPPYRDRRIHVHIRLTPEEATFVVRDDGNGFDPDSLPDPTDPENLTKPSGRGVLLMRSFMDDVTFNDQGNQVTMIKNRCSPDENGDDFDDEYEDD